MLICQVPLTINETKAIADKRAMALIIHIINRDSYLFRLLTTSQVKRLSFT